MMLYPINRLYQRGVLAMPVMFQQRIYKVQLIDYTKRGRHVPKDQYSSPSLKSAATEANRLAEWFRQRGYIVTRDNKFKYEVPDAVLPYIIYDYPNREYNLEKGLGRGSFVEAKDAYRIQIVDNNNEPVEMLFMKGILSVNK